MTIFIQHERRGILQHFTDLDDSVSLPRTQEYVLVGRNEYLVFKVSWKCWENPTVYIYVMDPPDT